MIEPPKVSILIPCYNASSWIKQCIESAIGQAYENTEVIVVDDGSQDGTWDQIQEFRDQVTAVRQENAGGNVTRNRLLELASGEWLQYLDADDWLGPNKVLDQIGKLRELDFDFDVIFGEVQMAYMEGNDLLLTHLSSIAASDPWVLLATWQLPQTGAPLWRKEALVSVDGWKADQPCCQEHELYLRLLKAGMRFVYGGPTSAFYRQWSDDTVCKRNVPLVHEKRMEIVMAARDFLLETGNYSPARREAVCQAAFDTARSAYAYDKNRARDLYKFIRGEAKGFVPVGPSAPPAFLFLARILGYMGAEFIADLKRRVRG